MANRVCSRCSKKEPKVNFEGKRKICNSCRGQLYQYRRTPEAKAKAAEKSREFRQKNPEKTNLSVWSANLRRLYGITPEQYQELLDAQDHKCAVCKRPTTDFPRRLAVDHNHHSGEVRGLLCTNCNHRVVGRYRDSTLLRAAADYLDQTPRGWIVPKKKKKRKKRNVRPRKA